MGNQHHKCKECGIYYTIEPKQHAYPEESREPAIKMYYGVVSGFGAGKIPGINKSKIQCYELDKIERLGQGNKKMFTMEAEIVRSNELYWFMEYKP